MSTRYRFLQFAKPSLPLVLLVGLLMLLWLAGGASRADALGQVVVRAGAWVTLVVAALFAKRSPVSDARPVWLLLFATIGLACVQLIPLPPSIWLTLPGRDVVAPAALDGPQPWRPWTMTPGATVNATSSLVVPLAVLLLATGLRPSERAWIPGLLLVLVVLSMLVALLQFSGAGLNNPFVNDTAGQISGNFANRNHLAVFLAMGCLLAPAWAFATPQPAKWRGVLALGLVIVLALTILASGSRAGMVVGILAIVIGLLLVRRQVRRSFSHAPKWAFPTLIGSAFALLTIFIWVSIAAGRAASIDRAFASDLGGDMRSRGLPTVLTMIREYWPFGSGLGGFDPMFRMHEPLALLKPSYFNHAHNDFLELLLDAGIPALILMLAALGWWLKAGIRAWRQGRGEAALTAKLGSAILFILLVASATDYPARTPMMMTVAVIAALWLSWKGDSDRSPLPTADGHL